ncbi:MAG: rhomboid family intramembrane serine protease [Limnohabitans sp.]|nr:rhomboid family intramembrane serine protease [Limnohabitans sp.]
MNLIQDLKFQYKSGDITTKLIFWNILLFFIPEVIIAVLKLFGYDLNYFDYVALPSNLNLFVSKFWTLITYNFFHGGFVHLAFNMIALYYIGRLFSTFFNQKQLFSVYVLGGVVGGIFFLLSYNFIPTLFGVQTVLVGASAAVMALLFATVTYQPFMNIRIPLIGVVKLWHIAILYLFLDLVQLPVGNTGGHLAHLGGTFFGFVYTKSLVKGIDLGAGLNAFLDWLVTLISPKKSTPFKKVHKSSKPKTPPQTNTSRIVTKDKTQQQIDEILDKISQSGYDSLTKEEKEFLFRAGK